jgi:uncharacterized membrane protein HdeD (DUF308 family)
MAPEFVRIFFIERKGVYMYETFGILWAVVTIIFGILIIAYPRLLRYTVGIYLIVAGLYAIIPRLHIRF